jgi:multicomponent Na+:H+ antiporter subunit G
VSALASGLALLSNLLLAAGVVYTFVGAIGLYRLPEFYTRTHAASVGDSGGAVLVLAGLLLRAESLDVVVRLLLIFWFLMFTSPTATHALAQAAIEDGLRLLPGRRRSARG